MSEFNAADTALIVAMVAAYIAFTSWLTGGCAAGRRTSS